MIYRAKIHCLRTGQTFKCQNTYLIQELICSLFNRKMLSLQFMQQILKCFIYQTIMVIGQNHNVKIEQKMQQFKKESRSFLLNQALFLRTFC